jgi:hypothetical protein
MQIDESLSTTFNGYILAQAVRHTPFALFITQLRVGFTP